MMGRVERRRQEKFNKAKGLKNSNIESLNNKDTFITMIKIIVVIILVLLVLYFVVAVFVTKEISFTSGDDVTEEAASSVTDKILAKNIFNQQESEYYVYFYDFDDEDLSVGNAIYNLSEDKVYRVDTGSSLNSNYVSDNDTGNKGASSLDDLMVINPTLIKVSNDSIVEYYEDVDEILAFLED